MRPAKQEPKLHGLVREELRQYARDLRNDNPGVAIRNAFVFHSAIRALSKGGYIALIGGGRRNPNWVTDRLERYLRRIKGHEAWVPGPKYSRGSFLFKLVRPTLRGGKIVWALTHQIRG